MPRIDALHWCAEQGQTWAELADAMGCTRKQLLNCNGHPLESPPPLRTGQVVHCPFVEA